MVYIIYNSITHAGRIRRVFEGHPRVALLHAPSGLMMNNCAYALRVPKEMVDIIYRKSTEFGITIRGAFEELPEGGYHDISR